MCVCEREKGRDVFGVHAVMRHNSLIEARGYDQGVREREREREREEGRERVCVCVRERERTRERCVVVDTCSHAP